MVSLNSCRDLADNAPARPDWRTPSYCANLQAPRDTWVQLRTASLVEPTHHVSVCPPLLPPLPTSFPRRSVAGYGLSPMCTSAHLSHQIWSPPSYATAQILHGLPLVTTGTRHLSARTKLKCNSHFTIIVIMRHSFTFFQKLLLFFILFICQAVITLFCMVILFPHFPLLYLSLELQKDS